MQAFASLQPTQENSVTANSVPLSHHLLSGGKKIILSCPWEWAGSSWIWKEHERKDTLRMSYKTKNSRERRGVGEGKMDGSSKRSQGWMRDSRPGGMQEKWGLDLRSAASGSCSSGDRSKAWSSLHTMVWILNCTSSVNVVPSRTKKFQCTTNLRAKGTVPLGFY